MSSDMEKGVIVFLGTGEIGVPTLRALVAAGEQVALVVTQPDRPKGRGRKLKPTPVKTAALELGLTVTQPENVNEPEFVESLRALAPEFLVLVDYGQLLRAPLLEVSERGPVNMHPSLLPRHRGPTPVSTAILSGDAQTGVSTMLMDEGMDTGPLLLQKEMELPLEINRGELGVILSQMGAELAVETVRGVRDGSVKPHRQQEARATYTKMIEKSMRNVDWSLAAEEVTRCINALAPRPGARSRLEGKMIKLLHAHLDPYPSAGEPGQALGVTEAGVRVACGTGAVVLLEVHPEGRKPMTAAAFARGGGVKQGDIFTF